MTTAYPLDGIKFRAFDANGAPLSGGKVYTFAAGTTTPKATFTDKTAEAANVNPVILDANGSANIYIVGSYYIRITDSEDNLLAEADNVSDMETIANAVLNASGAGLATLDSRLTDAEQTITEQNDQINENTDDIAAVQSALTAEISTNRPAAVSTALASAKAYTDANVSTATASFAQQLDAIDNPASTTVAGLVMLVNDLTTGGANKALTAEQGKQLKSLIDSSADQTAQFATNGFKTFADGLTIQWGRAVAPTNGQSDLLLFPKAFDLGVYICFGNKIYLDTGDLDGNSAGVFAVNSTQYRAYADQNGGDVQWIAIGRCTVPTGG